MKRLRNEHLEASFFWVIYLYPLCALISVYLGWVKTIEAIGVLLVIQWCLLKVHASISQACNRATRSCDWAIICLLPIVFCVTALLFAGLSVNDYPLAPLYSAVHPYSFVENNTFYLSDVEMYRFELMGMVLPPLIIVVRVVFAMLCLLSLLQIIRTRDPLDIATTHSSALPPRLGFLFCLPVLVWLACDYLMRTTAPRLVKYFPDFDSFISMGEFVALALCIVIIIQFSLVRRLGHEENVVKQSLSVYGLQVVLIIGLVSADMLLWLMDIHLGLAFSLEMILVWGICGIIGSIVFSRYDRNSPTRS